jgi:GH18 family chitinase
LANFDKIDPFKIEDIDPTLCTHINYGFAKINEFTYEMESSEPFLDLKTNIWDLSEFFSFS